VGQAEFLAVALGSGHLYVPQDGAIAEYGPATDGVPNELVQAEMGKGVLPFGADGPLAIDEKRHEVYLLKQESFDSGEFSRVSVFDSEAPYGLIRRIDGSTVPGGHFVSFAPNIGMAIDEDDGHLFISDPNPARIYELDQDGSYLGKIDKPKLDVVQRTIAIDNSAGSPSHGYLYVPSGQDSGHLFAFEPKAEAAPPMVESLSFAQVTEDEAVLQATVNPKSEPAHWTLEYTTEQSFEELGDFSGAQLAGEGTISPGDRPVKIFAPATALAPGTAYRFRVRAENQCEPGGCTGEDEGSFRTFSLPTAQHGSCSNQGLRTGASAALPDCRVYELVTPADTGGLLPLGALGALFSYGENFSTPTVSPAGGSLVFSVQGGLIPRIPGGNGSLNGDLYRSLRSAVGWRSEAITPDGSQATFTIPIAISADQGYFSLEVRNDGSPLGIGESLLTDYIRFPGGSFHLAGAGSLATAPDVGVLHIAPAGSHTLFATNSIFGPYILQLEESAPPDGTKSIYDRTSDGVVHVVSLLPGEVTPAAGQHALFTGASADGSSVAFTIAGAAPTYLRVDNARTVVAAPAGAKFGGLSADGRYFFYLLAGDLYRFDSETEATEPISASGDVEPVNIGSEGSGGYFLSPSVLGTGPNPRGAEPQAGKQNLYHWEGDGIDFVATVTDRDAEGEVTFPGESNFDGLGLWAVVQKGHQSQIQLSSRASADGATLLFESRADLTGFEAGGKAEIFRYEAVAGTLDCVSCDPTGAAPVGDASLSSFRKSVLFYKWDEIPNLTADGKRAFFETPERLLVGDNDGLVDVYEWEAEGKGTCAQVGGCLFLISSGQSTRDNRIFGVSATGDDVFIHTSDLLNGEDADDTPSVYDARVGGGFSPPTPPPSECLGEACQPAAAPPADATPNSASYNGNGNATSQPSRRCPKGKREVRRGGVVHCVRPHKKKQKRQQHRKQSPKRRAQR
jgi:hypothetical protein